METGRMLALGVSGSVLAYAAWKLLAPPPVTPDYVTWSFPEAGMWGKHLPDAFTGEVILDDLIVPLGLQGVYLGDLFWAPGAPGATLLTMVAGEDYFITVADAGEGWPLEWTIPLV